MWMRVCGARVRSIPVARNWRSGGSSSGSITDYAGDERRRSEWPLMLVAKIPMVGQSGADVLM